MLNRDVEKLVELVRKLQSNVYSNTEKKLDAYLAMLKTINLFLTINQLTDKSYYPIEWDDRRFSYSNGLVLTEKLYSLSLQYSLFSDFEIKISIMCVCDEILNIHSFELKQKIDFLKKHGDYLIKLGKDKSDDFTFKKGLEILRRTMELENINNQRQFNDYDELYYIPNQHCTQNRQEYFANTIYSILYPEKQYDTQNMNKHFSYQNESYYLPVIINGTDILANHRGYKAIAATVANTLFKPLGIIKGIYKLSTTGIYSSTLFSTETETENLLHKVETTTHKQCKL